MSVGSSPGFSLSAAQAALAGLPQRGSTFLEGPAGCGKTTSAAARLAALLKAGIPGASILVLIPHRPLAAPYLLAAGLDLSSQLDRPSVVSTDDENILTLAGLAAGMVRRYWSLVAGPSGFANPRQPPVFLNHETAQVVMARVALPLLEQGYFETVTLERSRLYSQILDSLSRAAGAGIPYVEIGHRLKSAWTGDPSQRRVFDDLQECAVRFRQVCLSHNLLDFSLLVDVFKARVWSEVQVREAFFERYRHLIAENIEEDFPVTHDLIKNWLPRLESALMLYDTDGGYRGLLGADPASAYSLKELCSEQLAWDGSYIMSPEVAAFSTRLQESLSPSASSGTPPPTRRLRDAATQIGQDVYRFSPLAAPGAPGFTVSPVVLHGARYYPEMLDWVASQVADMLNREGLLPSQIALLAPFLTDSLRFSLVDRLQRAGISVHSLRPSRPLRDEPGVGCLLTLAELAYPYWFEGSSRREPPSRYDVAYALVSSIEGFDLVRAQLLAEIAYRVRDGQPVLAPFAGIRPDMQERITFELGERYELLREWLEAAGHGSLELDEFWGSLLDQLLAGPGFRFGSNTGASLSAANLIDSARVFRQAIRTAGEVLGSPTGLEFITLVHDGLVPAQYLRLWQAPAPEEVLLAPAYTFLIANRPVEVQFWIDAASRDWSGRLHQPLTHTHILSRLWPEGQPWTDQEELAAGRESLYRLALGLSRRCRAQVWVAFSQLSEAGYEQDGPLLRVFEGLAGGE